MNIWKVNQENVITIFAPESSILKAYYVLENSNVDFTLIAGSFQYNNGRHTLKHTFSVTGNYIIKVIDETNAIRPMIDKLIVDSEFVLNDVDTIISKLNDLPTNINNISSLQNITTKVNLIPGLAKAIDLSDLRTVANNISSKVNTLPTLSEMLNSTLSKTSSIDAVYELCELIKTKNDSLPTLSEITSSSLLNDGDLSSLELKLSTLLSNLDALPTLSEMQVELANESSLSNIADVINDIYVASLNISNINNNVNDIKSSLPTLAKETTLNSALSKIENIALNVQNSYIDIDTIKTTTSALPTLVTLTNPVSGLATANALNSFITSANNVLTAVDLNVDVISTSINSLNNIVALKSAQETILTNLTNIVTSLNNKPSSNDLTSAKNAILSEINELSTVADNTYTLVVNLPTLAQITNPVNGLAKESSVNTINSIVQDINSAALDISNTVQSIETDLATKANIIQVNELQNDSIIIKNKLNTLSTSENLNVINSTLAYNQQALMTTLSTISSDISVLPTLPEILNPINGLASSSDISALGNNLINVKNTVDLLPILSDITSTVALKTDLVNLDAPISTLMNNNIITNDSITVLGTKINATKAVIDSVLSKTQEIDNTIDNIVPTISSINTNLNSTYDLLSSESSDIKSSLGLLATSSSTDSITSELSAVKIKINTLDTNIEQLTISNSNISTQTELIKTEVQKIQSLKNLSELHSSQLIDIKDTADNIVLIAQDTLDTVLPINSKFDSTSSLINSTTNDVKVLIGLIPSLAQIRNELINVHFGKLEIVNNQMKIYDKSNVLIVTFDLFDKAGLPTMGAVFKREVR